MLHSVMFTEKSNNESFGLQFSDSSAYPSPGTLIPVQVRRGADERIWSGNAILPWPRTNPVRRRSPRMYNRKPFSRDADRCRTLAPIRYTKVESPRRATARSEIRLHRHKIRLRSVQERQFFQLGGCDVKGKTGPIQAYSTEVQKAHIRQQWDSQCTIHQVPANAAHTPFRGSCETLTPCQQISNGAVADRSSCASTLDSI
ncbi:hypothetical protein C8R45DRAFT_1069653 [Mycena sanguinolenta]|nr:hypothetical protein C8R45DRAFT_1069653 [Mycena sanguinolenta]